MEQLRQRKGFLIDMDGVIYHGNRLLPGVKEFVQWLNELQPVYAQRAAAEAGAHGP